MKLEDCYRVLGVPPSASSEEIRKEYLVLVNVWHPDRFAHDPSLRARADAKLKELNEAYQQIRDAPLRTAARSASDSSSSEVRPAAPSEDPARAAAVQQVPVSNSRWVLGVLAFALFGMSAMLRPYREITVPATLVLFGLLLYRRFSKRRIDPSDRSRRVAPEPIAGRGVGWQFVFVLAAIVFGMSAMLRQYREITVPVTIMLIAYGVYAYLRNRHA